MDSDTYYPKFPPDSCINCGFLAAWNSYNALSNKGEALEPARFHDRESGFFGVSNALSNLLGGKSEAAQPLCWVAWASLSGEVEELAAQGVAADNEARLRVIQKDRKCPRAVLWKPWLSLREHWEWWMMDSFEEQRRAWQLDLEEQRRRWESTLETNRQLYEAKLEGERKSFEIKLGDDARGERRDERRENRLWLLAQVILSVAAIAAAAVFTGGGETSYYGEGSPTPPSEATP